MEGDDRFWKPEYSLTLRIRILFCSFRRKRCSKSYRIDEAIRFFFEFLWVVLLMVSYSLTGILNTLY